MNFKGKITALIFLCLPSWVSAETITHFSHHWDELLPHSKIEQSYETKLGKVTFRYITGAYEKGTFHLEVVFPLDRKQAETKLRERSIQIETIYDGVQDPYFTAITKRTACPDSFNLLHKKRGNATYYSAFANKNETFGSCVKKDIYFKVEIASLYCEKHSELLYLEVKTPVKNSLPNGHNRKKSLEQFSQLHCG